MPGFGDRLKTIRISHGLTQKEVALRLGISYQAYAQYERAENDPKRKTLERLALALNCSVTELLWGAADSGGISEESYNYKQINNLFRSLNESGQAKTIDYARDLSQIPAYQAASAPDREGQAAQYNSYHQQKARWTGK